MAVLRDPVRRKTVVDTKTPDFFTSPTKTPEEIFRETLATHAQVNAKLVNQILKKRGLNSLQIARLRALLRIQLKADAVVKERKDTAAVKKFAEERASQPVRSTPVSQVQIIQQNLELVEPESNSSNAPVVNLQNQVKSEQTPINFRYLFPDAELFLSSRMPRFISRLDAIDYVIINAGFFINMRVFKHGTTPEVRAYLRTRGIIASDEEIFTRRTFYGNNKTKIEGFKVRLGLLKPKPTSVKSKVKTTAPESSEPDLFKPKQPIKAAAVKFPRIAVSRDSILVRKVLYETNDYGPSNVEVVAIIRRLGQDISVDTVRDNRIFLVRNKLLRVAHVSKSYTDLKEYEKQYLVDKLKSRINLPLPIYLPDEEPFITIDQLEILRNFRNVSIVAVEKKLIELKMSMDREDIFFWLERLSYLEREGLFNPVEVRNLTEFYNEVRTPFDSNDKHGEFRRFVMVRFFGLCGGKFNNSGITTRKRGVSTESLLLGGAHMLDKSSEFVQKIIDELIDSDILKYSNVTKRFILFVDQE